MPDAMCLGKLDANAYTEDDDNVVEEGIEFWRPRAKYSETHSPFLGRASYWLLPAVSLIIFDFGFVARCYIFFYSLRQKRNKIEGAACWLSYFISQREACIVFDFFFSSILLFIFEVRHLRWISFFFRAFRVAVIIGKAPNCFRVNASKFRFFYYRWNDDSTFQLNLNSSLGKCKYGVELCKFDSNEAKRIRFHRVHQKHREAERK